MKQPIQNFGPEAESPRGMARSVSGAKAHRGRNKNERGFSLLLIALAGTVMIGMLGLAFDVGRMFVVEE